MPNFLDTIKYYDSEGNLVAVGSGGSSGSSNYDFVVTNQSDMDALISTWATSSPYKSVGVLYGEYTISSALTIPSDVLLFEGAGAPPILRIAGPINKGDYDNVIGRLNNFKIIFTASTNSESSGGPVSNLKLGYWEYGTNLEIDFDLPDLSNPEAFFRIQVFSGRSKYINVKIEPSAQRSVFPGVGYALCFPEMGYGENIYINLSTDRNNIVLPNTQGHHFYSNIQFLVFGARYLPPSGYDSPFDMQMLNNAVIQILDASSQPATAINWTVRALFWTNVMIYFSLKNHTTNITFNDSIGMSNTWIEGATSITYNDNCSLIDPYTCTGASKFKN